MENKQQLTDGELIAWAGLVQAQMLGKVCEVLVDISQRRYSDMREIVTEEVKLLERYLNRRIDGLQLRSSDDEHIHSEEDVTWAGNVPKFRKTAKLDIP